MKAIKNEVEVDGEYHLFFRDNRENLLRDVSSVRAHIGFVNAHIKDAVAFCCFFAWLEKQLSEENSKVTELAAAQQLSKYRR